LRGFLSKIRNILLLFRSILREIRAQIVFIILLLGVFSPFYIFPRSISSQLFHLQRLR
jgi:hypothetical protein